MIELHFIEANETVPSLQDLNPSIIKGAEEYRDYLINCDKERTELKKQNPKEFYVASGFPITSDFTITKKKGRSFSYKNFKCVEYLIGEQMFTEWKWNTPEVQEAYTKSKVAAADFNKQYESNPELGIDVLDNLKDRTEYKRVSEAIEQGIKVGKYEN